MKNRSREILDNCICSNLGHKVSEFIEVDIVDDIKGCYRFFKYESGSSLPIIIIYI